LAHVGDDTIATRKEIVAARRTILSPQLS